MKNTKESAIAVLIPLYNSQDYIEECLNSLREQTFKDFQVYICDDGSSDDSINVVKRFMRSTKLRIVLLKNVKNIGVAATRNRLIDTAESCKYIVWQDADDISYPNRLAKLFDYMEKHSDVGMCGSNLLVFDNKGNEKIRKYYTDDKDIRKMIFTFVPLAQPAAIVRREVFKNIGLFDPELKTSEDLEMLFRIGERYKLANIDENLIKYRNHDSITSRKLKEMEINTLRIRRKFFKNSQYYFSTKDLIFNILHYLSIFLIPASLKIKLFQLLRDR